MPHSRRLTISPRRSRVLGFTLVEVMVVVAMIAILAALALPAYGSYVRKSRARSASSDLAALALNLENKFQLQLAYPVNGADTAATSTLFPGWSATVADFFTYTVQSTASTYTLTATGTGALAGCSLSITNTGSKTADTYCGFTSW